MLCFEVVLSFHFWNFEIFSGHFFFRLFEGWRYTPLRPSSSASDVNFPSGKSEAQQCPDLDSEASSVWNFCARFSESSFWGETSGGVVKCRLFTQASEKATSGHLLPFAMTGGCFCAKLQLSISSNISSIRRSVSSPGEKLRSELKIRRAAEYFWRTLRCFM